MTQKININEELKKGDIFKLNGMKPEQLAKMIASKYGVNPADFTKGKSDSIVYSPKRQAKPKQETISKPEDMSVEEYKEKYVIPMKPELKDEEGEEWRPVPNKGRYFGGEADYSNYYEISNLGRLRLINLQNAAKSSISCGYDAPTRKAMQFHLNHKSGMNTCPDVKYMVADAFLGEHDLQDNMVIHIDGDYHNNRADNLKWVPRKKQNAGINEAFVKAFNKGKGRHDLQQLISEGVKRMVTESFDTKYENAIDTIEYYMGLHDETGMPLSQEQTEQLEQIVNFLKETDAADNPNTEYWISEAEKLLNNENTMYNSNTLYEAVRQAIQQLMEKSGIEIKPENKGKFTATKKRTGKSTSELLHSKNPKTRQRANFARMAKRGWKPLDENDSNDYNQDNFEKFVDVLEECGWAYSSFEEVRSKTTGQTGTRFGVEANRNGACSSEELQQKLKQAIPENLLVFSMGQHRYAPEIKRLSIVLLDEPKQEESLNEDGQATPDIEAILARINAAGVNQAMPRKQQQSQPSTQTPVSQHSFQIGTYTYNAGQHQLTGPQGFSKYLSKTEADLLLILCENMNQVVSRDTIINAVWTKGEEGKNFNARSVDVYMVKLRQYLSLDPNVNIYSVRGQGFKLEVKE